MAYNQFPDYTPPPTKTNWTAAEPQPNTLVYKSQAETALELRQLFGVIYGQDVPPNVNTYIDANGNSTIVIKEPV